ncbi:hypothetical protein D3C77_34540 [compost metagenome]
MELPIIHALRSRDRYRLLRGAVHESMIGEEAKFVLGWIAQYWTAYPAHDFVDVDALDSLIKLRGNYSPEQFALVKLFVNRLREPVDDETIKGVTGLLAELDYRGKVAALTLRHEAGDDINLVYELSKLTESAKQLQQQSTADQWIEDDVKSILDEEAGDVGIKLPTRLLRDSIKGMLGGASVALAARPDKGKSSLTAFIAAHTAAQIHQHFDADRPLLWLNNEGMGKRLIPRIYQAALDVTVDELYAMSPEELERKYVKKMGRKDRIRVKDMHGADLSRIEQVIEKMKPAIVVTDMPANFKMPGGGSGSIIQDTENKWQELREMACRHDFLHFGTCQISNDGDDQLYPAYSHLKDSKTGIQGATDIILMLGALNSPDAYAIRGLSTPKNKFALPGKRSHVQGEVVFDAPKCQFRDGGV